MCALIILIIAVFIFACCFPVVFGIVTILAIVITPWVFTARRRRYEKIVSAEVISRTQIMKEECRASGFSIGLRGNPRMYWGFRQVPSYIEVKVNVEYEDGKHRQLTLVEGSDRYNLIMAIGSKRE